MQQCVLITAGASGIGKEIARTLAANGAKVCVCDIDAKAFDVAAKDIPGLKTALCDMSKRDDIERMVVAPVDMMGGLDVLVNNAGISGPTAPVEDVDPDQWEAVMTVDIMGTFHVTRLCIPHLKKSSAGSIVVMSSLGGRFGYPNRSAYCTAKMGSSVLQKRCRGNWVRTMSASTLSRREPSPAIESNAFFRAAHAPNTKRWRRQRRLQ